MHFDLFYFLAFHLPFCYFHDSLSLLSFDITCSSLIFKWLIWIPNYRHILYMAMLIACCNYFLTTSVCSALLCTRASHCAWKKLQHRHESCINLFIYFQVRKWMSEFLNKWNSSFSWEISCPSAFAPRGYNHHPLSSCCQKLSPFMDHKLFAWHGANSSPRSITLCNPQLRQNMHAPPRPSG